MSGLFNGYLAFDDFADDAVKIVFFKWLGQNNRSIDALINTMRQRFNCVPFDLLNAEKLNVYVKVHRAAGNCFVVFEVVDNIVGDPIE